MFAEFDSFQVVTQSAPEVVIHGVKSRATAQPLPTLLLIHGFPQNYRIWHRIASQLASEYNVIALDLRGYGKSSKPKDVTQYAKSKMARDCVEVLKHFRVESCFVCAHDRGARVAHKLTVDHPQLVRKAIFLDIAPTLAMYTKTDVRFASKYFHWFFLIQPEPLPEDAVSSNPQQFAINFMGGRQIEGIKIFDPENFASYVWGLGDADTIHGMCQDYRASATLDLEEAREDIAEGRLVQTPLRLLWGSHGIIGELYDPVAEWKAVAQDGLDIAGRGVDSGHYIPEQASEEVLKEIRDFLK